MNIKNAVFWILPRQC